jgi:signal transduction histidine kinase
MTAFMREVLAGARGTSGGKKAVSIAKLFEQAMAVALRRARQHHAEVMADPSGADLQITADPMKLLLALTMLIINAIECVPSGGHVALGASRAGDKISIRVKDNGPGLSKDQVRQVFKPFSKTDQSLRTRGLALSIVQGIVRDHGGWIDVKTEIGSGCTFEITLPIGGV